MKSDAITLWIIIIVIVMLHAMKITNQKTTTTQIVPENPDTEFSIVKTDSTRVQNPFKIPDIQGIGTLTNYPNRR